MNEEIVNSQQETIWSPKQLSDYLEQAMHLESAIYAYDRIVDDTKNEIDRINRNISRSKPEYTREPDEPEKEICRPSIDEKPNLFLKVIKWIGIGIAIVAFLLYLEVEFVDDEAPLYVIFGVCISIGVGSYFSKLSEYKEAQKNYKHDLERIESQYQSDVEEYKKQLEEYTIAKRDAERKNNQKKENLKRQSNALERILPQLITEKDNIKRTLKKIYDFEIIYPKYRNLTAVATMYEYFMSGRVEMLQGRDGAYNLYEAEMRQNIIIVELNEIIDDLESIRNAQFALYDELSKMNKTVEFISNDIGNISKDIDNVVANQDLIAQTSSITARNTEAIKYINLIQAAK